MAVSAAVPVQPAPYRGLIFYHLVLLIILALGAAVPDALGRILRTFGAALALVGCLAAQLMAIEVPSGYPEWSFSAYPLVMAIVLAVYGIVLRHRPSLAVAGLVCVSWLVMTGWQGYLFLRQLLLGLDYIALSLAVFALAFLISVGKSGMLSRLVNGRREEVPMPLE